MQLQEFLNESKNNFIDKAMADGLSMEQAQEVYSSWIKQDLSPVANEVMYKKIWDNMDYDGHVPHPDDDVDEMEEMMWKYINKKYT